MIIMASTQFDSPKDAGERNVSGAKEYSGKYYLPIRINQVVIQV